jgi:hypothetical protein
MEDNELLHPWQVISRNEAAHQKAKTIYGAAFA